MTLNHYIRNKSYFVKGLSRRTSLQLTWKLELITYSIINMKCNIRGANLFILYMILKNAWRLIAFAHTQESITTQVAFKLAQDASAIEEQQIALTGKS